MNTFNSIFESEDTEASQNIAEKLTRRFVDTVFAEQSSLQLEDIDIHSDGLPLSDVNAHLTTLKNQISLLQRFGFHEFPMLSLEDGYRLPLDIRQYFGDNSVGLANSYYDRRIFSSPFPEEQTYYWLRELSNGATKEISLTSTGSLRENLTENLKSFLSYRHAALFNKSVINKIKQFLGNTPPSNNNIDGNNGENSPPPNGSAIKYLTVNVHTAGHDGLTVSAAPAFFASWRKFGSPSSPVKGSLLPGTYVFGATGLSLPKFKKDSIPVDIPPNFDITINL